MILFAKGCTTAADCERAAAQMPSDLVLVVVLIAAVVFAVAFVWWVERDRG